MELHTGGYSVIADRAACGTLFEYQLGIITPVVRIYVDNAEWVYVCGGD